MDLKKYFRKIREIEDSITEPYVLVSSLETADGGRPGVVSEVPRSLAARMMAEGRAALASKEEQEAYFERMDAARAAAQKAELARRLQVTIVSEGEATRTAEPVRNSLNGKK